MNTSKKLKIKTIRAREILDSRGQPTVEVEMTTDGKKVRASCPSGTSVGKYEKPVLEAEEAVLKINGLSRTICKKEFASQTEFDAFLKKSSSFANVTLPLSIAFCRAFDTLPRPRKKTLPRPQILAFEGGVHSNSSLKIQEFLIMAKSVGQGRDFYQRLKKGLEKNGIDTDTGLEGGFAPNDLTDEGALELMTKLLPKGTKFGLDFGGSYYRGKEKTIAVDISGVPPAMEDLIKEFKIVSIEDPFGEDDQKSWKSFYRKFKNKLLIVGDDLVVTNVSRLRKALQPKVISAVIVKPNQIGNVSDTLGFVSLARRNKLKVIVSHRSGETNDAFIADLALSVNADYVKFGGLRGGERMAKYNRLLELGNKS